jgi:hypothetical protein
MTEWPEGSEDDNEYARARGSGCAGSVVGQFD